MATDVRALAMGATCFIAQVCRDLGIAQTINRIVSWDKEQCNISPGSRIVALIVNILVQRRPLYLVNEFYEQLVLPLLFDEPVTAEGLNDDALGRALDRLYEANPKRCFESIACQAVSRGHIEVRSVHADTTSVALYGRFEPTDGDLAFQTAHPERPLLKITHGHSKEHRPDLRQFIYGLVVSAEGVPLLGDVNDGNTSDKTWNQQMIAEIQTSILDPRRIVYVADSALVTRDNLEAMDKAKMRFVSRLPETYNLVDELKERAWKTGTWTEIGALRPGKHATRYSIRPALSVRRRPVFRLGQTEGKDD